MSTTSYRPDIDGLRAIAVVSVVLHHLSPAWAPGGYVGVDIFFVISGYLITRIIHSEVQQGEFSFWRFYERRIRRIFPALIAMLCGTFAVAYAILLPTDMMAMLRAGLGTVAFASNVVFWRDLSAGYFAATDSMANPLLHTWSLGVEEQFYLLFPVVLLVLHRCAGRWIPQLVWVATLLSLCAAAALLGSRSVAVFFLSPFRAWELLAGSLLALQGLPRIPTKRAREGLAAIGALALACSIALYTPRTPFPGVAALLPVFGACALIHAGGSGQTAIGRALSARPVVYVGLISYSLYLWHWPVIVFGRHLLVGQAMEDALPALGLISLAIAAASFHFLEQPFRTQKWSYRRIILPCAGFASVTIVAVAVTGLIHEGFAARYPTEIVAYDKSRTPTIPFVQCDDKHAGDWCRVGATDKLPTVVLWGDSHLLAWTPAVHEWFRKSGRSGYLAFTSACPPLFGVQRPERPACITQSDGVRAFLKAHPEVNTVALAARWSSYFESSHALVAASGPPAAGGEHVPRLHLLETLRWLRDQGIRVVLIGPVPSHAMNVPLALANGRSDLIRSSAKEQYANNGEFFASVAAARRDVSFEFVDPIQDLCTPTCEVGLDGVSLYRDAHHLSVPGAMRLAPILQDVFPSAPIAPRASPIL